MHKANYHVHMVWQTHSVEFSVQKPVSAKQPSTLLAHSATQIDAIKELSMGDEAQWTLASFQLNVENTCGSGGATGPSILSSGKRHTCNK